MGKPKIPMLGKKFGLATVVKEVDIVGKGRRFECLCDCGNITDIPLAYILLLLIQQRYLINLGSDYETYCY